MPQKKTPIIPPGEFIREELEARGWTQDDLARIVGRPLTAINEVITAKRAVTTATAQDLAAAFGTTPGYWLNLEAAHQASMVVEDADSENVKRRARLFNEAPVKEMEKRGWIKETKNSEDLENEVCRFFKVSSINDEPRIRAAARQSVSSSELNSAQIAMCYRALALAPAITVPKYNPTEFRHFLPKLHALAREPESARIVPKELGMAGVRLIVIERLPHTKMDGATLWFEGSPIILLSLRYDRIDWFWHTLQHEISHILDGEQADYLDLELEGGVGAWAVFPDIERKANEGAADRMIPTAKLESFIVRVAPMFSKQRIVQFSHTVGVHPGIVVGQLQHRKLITWNANREMLVKIRHHVLGFALTDGFGHRPEVR
jgi:HTH-type transcriptional regulator / antitoxin HigA